MCWRSHSCPGGCLHYGFTCDAIVWSWLGIESLMVKVLLAGPHWLQWSLYEVHAFWQGDRTQGDRDNESNAIITHQLCRMVRTNITSGFFHIRVLSMELPSSQTSLSAIIHLTIAPLIQKFDHLFQAPTILPPQRDTNHAIHLLPYFSQSTFGHIVTHTSRSKSLKPRLKQCSRMA